MSCDAQTSVVGKRNLCGRPMWPATHQVLRTVQLVRGGGTAGDEGLEHAAHHHRLHVLCHGLVVPRGEVVPKARLVWNAKW